MADIPGIQHKLLTVLTWQCMDSWTWSILQKGLKAWGAGLLRWIGDDVEDMLLGEEVFSNFEGGGVRVREASRAVSVRTSNGSGRAS